MGFCSSCFFICSHLPFPDAFPYIKAGVGGWWGGGECIAAIPGKFCMSPLDLGCCTAIHDNMTTTVRCFFSFLVFNINIPAAPLRFEELLQLLVVGTRIFGQNTESNQTSSLC